MSTCIVIHGTWGSKSDFAFADSLFCRALKAAADHDLAFERFEWSGTNSSVERARTAQRLSNIITNKRTEELPIFMVAHSHGGNVAVEALKNDETVKRVAGLITMGTPFLSSERRYWVSFLTTLPGKMSLYGILMGLVVASIIATVGSAVSMFHPIFGFLGIAVLISIFILASKASTEDLLESVERAVGKRASSLSGDQSKNSLRTNVLVVHSRGDEALWWLQRVMSLTNVPFTLLNAGLWLVGWSTIIGIALGAVYKLLRLFVEEEAIESLLTPMFVAIGLGFGLAVVSAVAILLVKTVQRAMGTGESVSAWVEIVTHTKATRLPTVECHSLQDMDAPFARVHGGLWHSKYMRSGEVVDRIAKTIDEWLLEEGSKRPHTNSVAERSAQPTLQADSPAFGGPAA